MERRAIFRLAVVLALATRVGLAVSADPDQRTPVEGTRDAGSAAPGGGPGTSRVIARAQQHGGDVTTTVPSPPPTAGAVPSAPPSGPQLSSADSTTARLENAPPAGSTRSRSADATAARLPPSTDAVLGTIANPLARAGPAPNGELQACIDRQLTRRGLNAFGDPPATRYARGTPAPVDSIGRYSYVLERSPSIRTACQDSISFR